MTIQTAASASVSSENNKGVLIASSSLTATEIDEGITTATTLGLNRADFRFTADLNGADIKIKQSDGSLIILNDVSLYLADLGYRSNAKVTNNSTIRFSVAWG